MTSRATCVIIDFDGTTAKVGLAGESCPRFVLPFDIEESRRDWSSLRFDLSALFQTIFYNKLHVKPRSIQVLIVENLYWPKIWRDCIYTVLLYDFQVAAISFQPSLFMNILASGSSSGIALCVLQKECVAICFAYHRPLLPTLAISSGGIRSAMKSFQELTEEKHSLKTQGAGDEDSLERLFGALSAEARGLLFDALLAGSADSECGLADLALRSLSLCPPDLRMACAGRVSVFGGQALRRADFVEALRLSMQQRLRLPQHQALQPLGDGLAFPAPPCAACAFLGASLFASLPSNQEKILSRERLLPAIPKPLARPLPATSSVESASPQRQPCVQPEEDEHQVVKVERGCAEAAGEEWAVRLAAPDWLSADPSQWLFFRPHCVAR